MIGTEKNLVTRKSSYGKIFLRWEQRMNAKTVAVLLSGLLVACVQTQPPEATAPPAPSPPPTAARRGQQAWGFDGDRWRDHHNSTGPTTATSLMRNGSRCHPSSRFKMSPLNPFAQGDGPGARLGGVTALARGIADEKVSNGRRTRAREPCAGR